MGAHLEMGQVIQELIEPVEFVRGQFLEHLPAIRLDALGKGQDMRLNNIQTVAAVPATARKIMFFELVVVKVVDVMHKSNAITIFGAGQ